jgi:CHAT domain-containing protein
LALAGANRPPTATGEVPGVLTGEELCGLDLTGCELAVLSGCETNVGPTRAGQGILSLQAALHAAGARSSLTSLWRVDDAATRALMVAFYRRIWVDGQEPLLALWGAKRELRMAGEPLRHWAGWVLSTVGD